MSVFGPYPATIISWHDGDTCHVNIDLGWGIHMVDTASCRIFGINAPELATDAGKAALAFAQGLCPANTAVKLVSHGWDKYGGRFDGSLTLPDGSDFATRMVAAGQAVLLP